MIDSRMKNNKLFSVLNLISCEILKMLKGSKQLQCLNFNAKPKQIRIFDKSELIKNFPDTFCTVNSKKILTNEPVFKPRSLFFRNDYIDLEEMNEMAQSAKEHGFIASDNFLTFAMHEWAHNIHIEYLYRTNKMDEKKVLEYIKKLKEMDFSRSEKALIHEYLGDYIYNNGKINPFEVTAESLNKIICTCLNNNKIQINQNIDTSVQEMPKELIEILIEILNFKL